MDLLKPNYNIFPVAASSLGFKHSEVTKEKLRIQGSSPKNLERLKNLQLRFSNDPVWQAKCRDAFNKLRLYPEWEAKRSEALKKAQGDPEWVAATSKRIKIYNASLKGRARPEGAGKPTIQIEVCDLITNQKITYPSRVETALALGISPRSVGRCISGNSTNAYKG